jgi:DNA repair exonuclease SbcCD ATPase subunit
MTVNSKKFIAAVNSQLDLWGSVKEFFEEVGQLEGLQRAGQEAQGTLNALNNDIALANDDLKLIESRIAAHANSVEEREAAIKERIAKAAADANDMVAKAKAEAVAIVAEAEQQRATAEAVVDAKIAEIGKMNKALQEDQTKLDNIRAAIAKLAKA